MGVLCARFDLARPGTRYSLPGLCHFGFGLLVCPFVFYALLLARVRMCPAPSPLLSNDVLCVVLLLFCGAKQKQKQTQRDPLSWFQTVLN